MQTNYDFTNAPDRSKTNSIKWDIEQGELSMSLADMDFQTAPEIITAMKKKINLRAFGYEWPGADYFNAVADWYAQEHGHRPDPDWMIFTTGVVPAISSIVRRVSHLGDNILVLEPVYNVFYNSIENNGRHVLSSDLYFTDENYQIDWQDLEQKLALPLTTLMIFCNPHNPIGKVWTKHEIQKVADLCLKHHVVLLSDEIHGDLVRTGKDYTPAFAVSGVSRENTITLVSPSKTFNVAALHAATAIIPNENLREIVNRGLNSDELAEPNLLAVPGTIAAYTEGQGWRQALIAKLNDNFSYATSFIEKNLPDLRVITGDATYLMWLDVHRISRNSAELAKFLRQETGLIVLPGSIYRGNGTDFLRINLACPLAMVQDGLQRLNDGIKKYQNNKKSSK